MTGVMDVAANASANDPLIKLEIFIFASLGQVARGPNLLFKGSSCQWMRHQSRSIVTFP